MAHITLLLALVLALFVAQPDAQNKPDSKKQHTTQQQTAKKQPVAAESIIVYYFHGARRCKTCLGIEDVTRSLLKEQYSTDKSIVFKSLDGEDEKNAALVERYQVAGSSLIVARGVKSEDLTTDAFQYALRDPDKLRRLLTTAIEKLRKG